MFRNFPEETIYAYPAPVINNDFDTAESLFNQYPFETKDQNLNSIYIHIPFCIHLCNFCGFVKTDKFDNALIDQYVDGISKEIELIVGKIGSGVHISSIYFGGGTASILRIRHVEQILECIHSSFHLKEDCSITFEGDCKTLLKKNYLKHLHSLGVDRLSFGVQVLDEGYRKLLNLKPSFEELLELNGKAKLLFKDVCIDYIYGWAGQDHEHLKNDYSLFLESFKPISVELFQFEKLDASPQFLKLLDSADIQMPPTNVLQSMYQSLRHLNSEVDLEEYSYTLFSTLNFSFDMSYFGCYYGIENAGILGFGVGAQSFYNQLMWGNTFRIDVALRRLENNKLIIDSLNYFAKGERQSVTWPRVGSLDLTRLNNLEQSYLDKVDILCENGYANKNGNKIVLTSKGQIWRPNIIQFLVKSPQSIPFDYETKKRYEQRFS